MGNMRLMQGDCLDRNFIGIERDADYFKIAKRRIEDAQRRLL